MSCSYLCRSSAIRGKSLTPSWPQALGVTIHPSLGGCENHKEEEMGEPSEKQAQSCGMQPEAASAEEQDCSCPGWCHPPWADRLSVFLHSCCGLRGCLLPQPHGPAAWASHHHFIWKAAPSPGLSRALAIKFLSQEGEVCVCRIPSHASMGVGDSRNTWPEGWINVGQGQEMNMA